MCSDCTFLSHNGHEIKKTKDFINTEKIQNLIDVNKLILQGLIQKTAIV